MTECWKKLYLYQNWKAFPCSMTILKQSSVQGVVRALAERSFGQQRKPIAELQTSSRLFYGIFEDVIVRYLKTKAIIGIYVHSKLVSRDAMWWRLHSKSILTSFWSARVNTLHSPSLFNQPKSTELRSEQKRCNLCSFRARVSGGENTGQN